MGARLYAVFCEIVDNTPAEGVLTLADLERRMLLKDLAAGRIDIDESVSSVLSFCSFVDAAARGAKTTSPVVPIDHLAFYRNTVERLTEAGQLPPNAKKQFDEAYQKSFEVLRHPPDDSTVRILHLEDDPNDGDLIAHELQKSGTPISIIRVASEDAFQTNIQTKTFDAVISDSGLPGFDTLKALAIVRDRFPGMPFIFLSGNANPRIKAETLRRGADDFLDKNDLAPLLQVIRRLVLAKKQGQPA